MRPVTRCWALITICFATAAAQAQAPPAAIAPPPTINVDKAGDQSPANTAEQAPPPSTDFPVPAGLSPSVSERQSGSLPQGIPDPASRVIRPEPRTTNPLLKRFLEAGPPPRVEDQIPATPSRQPKTVPPIGPEGSVSERAFGPGDRLDQQPGSSRGAFGKRSFPEIQRDSPQTKQLETPGSTASQETSTRNLSELAPSSIDISRSSRRTTDTRSMLRRSVPMNPTVGIATPPDFNGKAAASAAPSDSHLGSMPIERSAGAQLQPKNDIPETSAPSGSTDPFGVETTFDPIADQSADSSQPEVAETALPSPRETHSEPTPGDMPSAAYDSDEPYVDSRQLHSVLVGEGKTSEEIFQAIRDQASTSPAEASLQSSAQLSPEPADQAGPEPVAENVLPVAEAETSTIDPTIHAQVVPGVTGNEPRLVEASNSKPMKVASSPPKEEPPSESASASDPPPTVTVDAERRKPQIVHPKAVASRFNGVQPGTTTVDEMKELWGEPLSVAKDGVFQRQVYDAKPFRRIDVRIYRGTVYSILVHLSEAVEAESLAERLKLSDVRSTEVLDEFGKQLGRAFPERGVLFSYDDYKAQVIKLLLEPIDAQPFVLRAENHLHDDYERSLSDLSYATQLDPEFAHPHWLQARVWLAIGHYGKAVAPAMQAVRLDPKVAIYRATLAETLGHQGKWKEAIAEATRVRSDETASPLARAYALYLLGNFAAEGPKHDYKQAAQHHMAAIEELQPLIASEHQSIRREAKDLAVAAHLAVAHDIAAGSWKQKRDVIPRWIDRAVQFAEDRIANDGGGEELRLHVTSGALRIETMTDTDQDIDELMELCESTSEELTALHDDPLWKDRIDWELATAYVRATQALALRGEAEKASKYAALASDRLKQLSSDTLRPAVRELMTQLFFSIGAMHALQNEDHTAAVVWYDKAYPLLFDGSNMVASTDNAHAGEMLVGMGVSYWEVKLPTEAIRLTEHGTVMLKRAVEQGYADAEAMFVPYSNLSAMHRQLGNSKEAEQFAQLAKRHTTTVQK